MESIEKGLLEGMITALANKHSELELNFERTTLRFPALQMSVELSGSITLSVHMREMSEDERKALSTKKITEMSGP
jgi:hypothetical protein